MAVKLIEIPVEQLLIKFGADEHKPGSGSAAALQAMLTAQLIRTVITLSTHSKRAKYYADYQRQFQDARTDIEQNLYPTLLDLFQRDSDEFDRAIKLRRRRDAEHDLLEKRNLNVEAEEALVPAIKVPLKIAQISAKLFEYARFNFLYGFRSARGDSGVAMGGALSSISGCILIAELNLLSVQQRNGRDELCHALDILKEQYTDYNNVYNQCQLALATEHAEVVQFQKAIRPFTMRQYVENVSSDKDIERLVRRLQRIMWKFRHIIWRYNTPQEPLEILDPTKAIELLGYVYQSESALGVHEEDGQHFETAGLIDNKNALIRVAANADPVVVRFTAGHELGHAVLHAQTGLHRDRALDGGRRTVKSKPERQADKFSTFFLMPRIHVVPAFKQRFLTDLFTLDENTAFALASGDVKKIVAECKDQYGLARKLASVDYYNGVRFISLAEEFRVSEKAMATRLVELKMVKL